MVEGDRSRDEEARGTKPLLQERRGEKESVSNDPNDHNSLFQDTAVETLQSRGVQFMRCHTATEEQPRALVKHNNLSQSPEEIVKECWHTPFRAFWCTPPWSPRLLCCRPKAVTPISRYNPRKGQLR